MTTPADRPIVLSPRYHGIGELTDRVRTAERLGVTEIWLEQMPDQRDAMVAAAAYLQAAPSVSVGTAVLPIYARHPVQMAQAAATLGELSSGRFKLGLGYSHKFVNEYVLGLKQGPPIGVTREYVGIVKDMIENGSADSDGRHFTAHAQYNAPRTPVPLYLAALRPQMISLAVEAGEGIIIWLTSPRYVREQVMPAVREACAKYGRNPDEFRVLAMLPSYTGSQEDEQRQNWANSIASYRMLPYYRHVLDAYGTPDPEELSLIGEPAKVRERLAEYRQAGCIPVSAPMPSDEKDFIQTVEAAYGD